MAEDREEFWDRLLECIKEEAVIPVVGADLLVVALPDGRRTPLYSLLAERLAADLKVSAEGLPASGALHEVACRFKAAEGKLPGRLYYRLKMLCSQLEPDLEVPEPLRQLARIPGFRFFISLTFDSLLARAIDEERFGGIPHVRAVSYSPAGKDPDVDPEQRDPVVLHLFGKLSVAGDYAVTEEDVLEFVHSLQGGDRLPSLVGALPRRSLLLLGSSFPDWLTRFFLRFASGEQRLSLGTKTDVIADSHALHDSGLVPFLRSFSPETQVFDDPAAFIAELSRRWQAAYPKQGPTPPTAPVKPGAIFLSYAHEDLEAARAVRDALVEEGMEVWFDRTALQAGADFDDRISRGLQDCCLFVPLISRHALAPDHRYFRREWSQALRLLDGLPANRSFLVPVAIDDTRESEEAIPAAIRSRTWARWPADGGRLVADLKQEYRGYRQRQRYGQ